MFFGSDPAEKAEDGTGDENDDMNSEARGDCFFFGEPNHNKSGRPSCLQGSPIPNSTDGQCISNHADGGAKDHSCERDFDPKSLHIGVEGAEDHDPRSQACQTDREMSMTALDGVKIFCHVIHFLLNPQNELSAS